MLATRICLGFLSALLLMPRLAFGQTGTERNTENLEKSPGAPSHPGGAPDLSETKQAIIKLTNQFRAENQRGELKSNTKLAKAAQSFAEFLARTDQFSHTADGKEPWERVSAAGYQYCIVLENIAYEYNSDGFTSDELAQKLLRGWEDSPEHRKNLLDPDVTEIGVGLAQSSKTGRYYAVQDFGRPKSLETVFKIANPTNETVRYTLDGKSYTLAPGYTVTQQRCRPAKLNLQTDKAGKEAETVQPKNGDRYVLGRDPGGKLTLQKE